MFFGVFDIVIGYLVFKSTYLLRIFDVLMAIADVDVQRWNEMAAA